MRRFGLTLCTILALISAAAAQLNGGLMFPGPGTVHSTGGGGCSQATTFLARGTFDGTHTTAYTNLICGLVTDGLWSKADALVILGTQNTTVAALNLPSTSFTPTITGSPAFTADKGYLGVDASSTVFIDTGIALNATTQCVAASCAIILVVQDATQSGASGGNCIAFSNGSHQTRIFPRYSDGNAYFDVTSATQANTGTANASAKARYIANRNAASGAGSVTLYKNAVSFAAQNTGDDTSPTANNLYVLAQNNGTTATFGCPNTIGAYGVFAGLTGSDITNLDARLATFGSAVGWP